MRRLIVPALLTLCGAIAALAVAAPAVAAGGGGHGCVRPPRDGTDEPVVIDQSCFSPAVLYVQPGTTVEWQQEDLVAHNVRLFDGEVVGGETELYKGDAVSRTFEDPGVYAYYCTVHPSMLGVVVVGDPASPAFSASLSLHSDKADGQESQPVARPTKADERQGGYAWGEAIVGLGIFGGLLVGLVAVGGGIKLHRRMR